jgi:hypothetical protein
VLSIQPNLASRGRVPVRIEAEIIYSDCDHPEDESPLRITLNGTELGHRISLERGERSSATSASSSLCDGLLAPEPGEASRADDGQAKRRYTRAEGYR